MPLRSRDYFRLGSVAMCYTRDEIMGRRVELGWNLPRDDPLLVALPLFLYFSLAQGIGCLRGGVRRTRRSSGVVRPGRAVAREGIGPGGYGEAQEWEGREEGGKVYLGRGPATCIASRLFPFTPAANRPRQIPMLTACRALASAL